MKPRPERTKTETKAEKGQKRERERDRAGWSSGGAKHLRTRRTIYTLAPTFYLRFKRSAI